MGAQFGRRRSEPRTAPGRELALDLTADEVVLHEGSPEAGWRRFAGVALDDPAFLEMIGLLRAEAEEATGGRRPVRLWLPPEQVLALSVPIAERDPAARLRAAFERIAGETGHRPEDVALAVAPAESAGEITLLVAYAETWAEARDYAARWGFEPGPVSTRHHAADFAPAEPVFRLRSAAREAPPEHRRTAARAALGLAALACALAAPPAQAAQAPPAAPLPPARVAAGPVAAAQDGTAWQLAALPPQRPAGRAARRPQRIERSGVAAPVPPFPKPGKADQAAVADPGPAEGAAAPAGGLAAPLPAARPARAAARATAAGLPSIGAGAPPPVRAAAEERGLPLDRAALIGILNLESGRTALLRLPGGEVRRLRIGDVIEGWHVSAIGRDAMRVSRGGKDRTLLLVSR